MEAVVRTDTGMGTNVPPSLRRAVNGIVIVFGTFLALRFSLDALGVYRPGAYGTFVASLVALFYARQQGLSLDRMGWTLPKSRWAWTGVIGLGLLAIPGLVVYASLVITPIVGLLGTSGANDMMDKLAWFVGAPLWLYALVMLAVWITAGVGEEWLMRGFLLSSLESLFGGTRLATIAAALLQCVFFGALHYEQGAAGIVATGLVGLYLTAIFFIGGRRLLPVILAHGLIDTISLTEVYLTGSVNW